MENLKKLNILLLEDNEEFAKNTIEFLHIYFKDVFHSTTIKGALELYDDYHVDIIISDIKVTDGNGLDFIKAIRDKDKIIPIVILSAYKDEDFLFQAIPLNICSYEVKPLSYNRLLLLLKLLSSKFDTNEDSFIYKNLTYDFKTKTLFIDNYSVYLTKNEILFIELLITNKNNIVSYDMIQRDVYREKIMSDSSVKNLLLRVRKKLPTDFITSITGIGYKLFINE